MRRLLIAFLLSAFILFGALWMLVVMDNAAHPAESDKTPNIQLVEEKLNARAVEIFSRKHIVDGWVNGLMSDHGIKVDHFTLSLKVLTVDVANVKSEYDFVGGPFAVGAVKTVIAFGFIGNAKVRYVHAAILVFLIDKNIDVLDLVTVTTNYEILTGWGEGLDC